MAASTGSSAAVAEARASCAACSAGAMAVVADSSTPVTEAKPSAVVVDMAHVVAQVGSGVTWTSVALWLDLGCRVGRQCADRGSRLT